MNDEAENNDTLETTKSLKHSFMKECWKAIKDLMIKIQISLGHSPGGSLEREDHAFIEQSLTDVIDNDKHIKQSTLKDWLMATDNLILFVKEIRQQIKNLDKTPSEIDLLSASAYLYHLDKLLVIIRENYLTLQYREEQFMNKRETLARIEFFQAYNASSQCYHCVLYITSMLHKHPEKELISLYSEEFVRRIHELETECNNLVSAVRALNHFAYRQDAVAQLSKLEQDLFETFVYSRAVELNNGKVMYNNLMLHTPTELNSSTDYLKSKLNKIVRQEDTLLMNHIIEVYDALRRCYVVVRKAVIKETLEVMAKNIEAMATQLEEDSYNKESLFFHLHNIFNSVESLRFSSNRESRCSRHLFEKAKAARRELRKACVMHPIANEFLKEINMPHALLCRSLSK